MSIKNPDLKRRIIELSYRHNLSHLGSCLTAVDIIDEIYAKKKKNEKFILSAGHSGLSLYVILEKYEGIDAETLLKRCGVHPDRIASREIYETGYIQPIDCSTGSLGQGLPIAVGMALADRSKNVYCLISDGEMQEGSIYEALEVINEQKLTNLKVYINANGWGAYKSLNVNHLISRCVAFTSGDITFIETDNNDFPFLNGLDAHYHVMNEEEYNQAMEILKA